MKKERVLIKTDRVTYELGGDYFFYSFPMSMFSPVDWTEPEKLKQRIIFMGRKMAKEYNML